MDRKTMTRVFTQHELGELLEARDVLMTAMQNLPDPTSKEAFEIGATYHKLAGLIGYPDED